MRQQTMRFMDGSSIGCTIYKLQLLYSVVFWQNYSLEYKHIIEPTGWPAFSALTLLVGRQEGHPACKKLEWWGAGVVICLQRGADLHMVQLMPLPLTVSCFSKVQIGFTFLVLAHLGSPGKRAVKRVCVCVWLAWTEYAHNIWYSPISMHQCNYCRFSPNTVRT